MKQTENSTGLDYSHGNITDLFRKIFFPTLLGMLFNALITIVDGIFVGRGVGPDGIAAVNIIAPLYMVVTGVGLMFGIGSSVISGIILSQGDSRRASINMTQAMGVSGILITLLCIILTFWPERVAGRLGCSANLLPKALDYLLWLIPGMFFLLFQVIGMMVIRLDGSPKFAMMCNVLPAIINIILDWILVFPMNMGVKGAAIATSASILIGALMVLTYFLRFSFVMKFVWSGNNLLSNVWRQICIGSSAFITEIAMSVMMLTGNYVFMKYYGEAGVAAYSIACYLFPLMFMMCNAVAQSAQPIISYNYGANAMDRVREAFKVSIRVALICGGIVTISIALAADHIVALFIDPECEAGLLASEGLPVYSLCAIFFGVNISFIGYFQSIEKAVKAAVFTLLRGVIYLVPLFLILPSLWHGKGAWAAIPASEILTFITICITYAVSRRGNNA